MAKVYDIFTKKPLKPAKEYYDRFEACNRNKEQFGECKCHLCIEKRRIAYQVLTSAYKECTKYNKNVSNEFAWGDLLEIMIISARAAKTYIDKDK